MIKLELFGYGAEVCIGRYDEKTHWAMIHSGKGFKYFFDGNEDEHVQWYEIDDIFHLTAPDCADIEFYIQDNDKEIGKFTCEDAKVHYVKINEGSGYDNNEFILLSLVYGKGRPAGYINLPESVKEFDKNNLLIIATDLRNWDLADGKLITNVFYGKDVDKFLDKIKENYPPEEVYEHSEKNKNVFFTAEYKKFMEGLDVKELEIEDSIIDLTGNYCVAFSMDGELDETFCV